MRAVVATMAVAAAIAGCAETRHCNEGYHFRSGACVPVSTSDGSTPDAGADADFDAGNDAGMDGGPCDLCAATEHCTIGNTATDAGRYCVECLSDVDCLDLSDDAGLPVHQICEGFSCRPGCRTGSNCNLGVCRSNGTCSAYGPAVNVCGSCDTDQNCVTGLYCVTFPNAGHQGSYCLSPESAGSACSLRPSYSAQQMRSMSVDGRAEDTYCIPHGASCEAVRSFGRACGGASDPPCGDETGRCSSMHCTYLCPTTDPAACPVGTTCSAAMSICL